MVIPLNPPKPAPAPEADGWFTVFASGLDRLATPEQVARYREMHGDVA